MAVLMALVDYIPVILFAITAITLQRALYESASKGAFALLCGGTIMVITAGLFKATWKLLYALQICDFEKLNQCFFPLQSVGFLLAGIAMIALLCAKQGSTGKEKGSQAAFAAAVPVFSGTFVFVTIMIAGLGAMCGGLAVIAKRMKKPAAIACFVIAFVFMLGMGYLSAKDFSSAAVNWIAQGVNIAGQGFLLAGVKTLANAGLSDIRVSR